MCHESWKVIHLILYSVIKVLPHALLIQHKINSTKSFFDSIFSVKKKVGEILVNISFVKLCSRFT